MFSAKQWHDMSMVVFHLQHTNEFLKSFNENPRVLWSNELAFLGRLFTLNLIRQSCVNVANDFGETYGDRCREKERIARYDKTMIDIKHSIFLSSDGVL